MESIEERDKARASQTQRIDEVTHTEGVATNLKLNSTKNKQILYPNKLIIRDINNLLLPMKRTLKTLTGSKLQRKSEAARHLHDTKIQCPNHRQHLQGKNGFANSQSKKHFYC